MNIYEFMTDGRWMIEFSKTKERTAKLKKKSSLSKLFVFYEVGCKCEISQIFLRGKFKFWKLKKGLFIIQKNYGFSLTVL